MKINANFLLHFMSVLFKKLFFSVILKPIFIFVFIITIIILEMFKMNFLENFLVCFNWHYTNCLKSRILDYWFYILLLIWLHFLIFSHCLGISEIFQPYYCSKSFQLSNIFKQFVQINICRVLSKFIYFLITAFVIIIVLIACNS